MIEAEQIFIFVGVILVVFFAILLYASKKYKSYPNKFLATSLLILSLLIARIHGLLEGTFIEEFLELFRIEYLFASFLYMYVCFTLKKSIEPLTYIFLAGPFVLFSMAYTTILMAELFSYNTYENLIEQIEPLELYGPILFNSLIIVLFTLKVKRSDSEGAFKKWVYIISIGLIIVMLSFLILEFIEVWFNADFWEYLGMGISLFFIGLTYLGVQRLQVEHERKTIKKIYDTKKKTVSILKNQGNLTRFDHIKQLMKENEYFRNPDFNRESLASVLGLSASSITRILKEEGQIGFNDFVNRHRIALAKNMLKDERFDIFSLEAIGKEVGFKSRSTFYETFKKEVGISPGAFKKL